MIRKLTISFCLILLMCVACAGCSNTYYSYFDMTFEGKLPLVAEIAGKDADKAFAEMKKSLEELSGEININDPRLNTSVKQLNNAAANEEIELGLHAFYLLERATELYIETEGAFNVASYPLTLLWGTDVASLESMSDKPAPTEAQINAVKPLCDLSKLSVYKRDGKYFGRKEISGLMVDLGGIAKGYGADLCIEICKKYEIESALINLAGNLVTYGDYNGKNWEIRLKNPVPFGLGGNICAFEIGEDETAVTSGDYERMRIISDGVTVCHIIDTTQGMPYNLNENHIISCTVIGTNSMYADAYSTAACVFGVEKAVTFLENKGLKSLIFTSDKKMANVGGVKLVDTNNLNKYKEYEPYNG